MGDGTTFFGVEGAGLAQGGTSLDQETSGNAYGTAVNPDVTIPPYEGTEVMRVTVTRNGCSSSRNLRNVSNTATNLHSTYDYFAESWSIVFQEEDDSGASIGSEIVLVATA